MRESIEVALPGREYGIHVGPGLLTEAGSCLARLTGPCRILLVTNPTVARWYLQPFRESLAGSGFSVYEAMVPDGEEFKSFDQAALLYERAVEAELDRADCLTALGGGVVGDLAGFVAATYLRGLAFVQVPTTLLAQIDSSIGGKVAVNLPSGKNLVGAFHQPRLVMADMDTLKTLPIRELRAGLVEMLKHGLLEADYFSWYEKNLRNMLAGDEKALIEGITWSCRIKAKVVLADERERGPRALLNLGHTVGHALEKAAGYGVWRHGEAVGFGLLAAGRLARLQGYLDDEELLRLEKAVRDTLETLPYLPAEQIGVVVGALARDKKIMAGKLRFVLPRGIGGAVIDDKVTIDMVEQVLSDMAQEAGGRQ